MVTQNVKLVPLNTDERELLLVIYKVRRKVCAWAFVFMYVTVLYIWARKLSNAKTTSGLSLMDVDVRDIDWSSFFVMWLGIGLFFILITILLIWTLKTNVLPFRADYKEGMKEAVDTLITGKQSFPLTGQYFLNLDNPKYPNHEVDGDFYNNCEAGDTIILYRAPHSKYYFEKDGKFTIM